MLSTYTARRYRLGARYNGDIPHGLGEEALIAVLEHRAALAALGTIEGGGRSRERIVLLTTGSRPLAKREEEPFALWRATRRRKEGASLKEILTSLPRFGDLSVAWWPCDPEGVGTTSPSGR